MGFVVPDGLAASARRAPDRAAWLARLPGAVAELAERWSLELGPPIDTDEVSAAWVAPAMRADGTVVVLKLGMPHFEADDEIAGLRFWDGDPTVRLLDADDALNAMLLERCEPGTALRVLPEPEQDEVIAGLLRRLWRPPPGPRAFRPLSEMTAYWGAEALAIEDRWVDPGLVGEALTLFDELPRGAPQEVVLATDLHAGNVLRARREPWLAIDPKPFVGDPAYDATQHLLNCDRLRSSPVETIERVAGLLDLDRERVRLWTFARIAIENADDRGAQLALARQLAG
jgi:streptomycin 6-kinase